MAAPSKGAAIRLARLWKSYGEVVAVGGIDLAVAPGEFCTLLGPSGSGKSTLLMMIAGFVLPDRGEILVDNRAIDRLPPQKRNLGVVFQSYALFPHMTVAGNVAFPLQMRGVPKGEIKRRVDQVLETVALAGLAERYPRQLSGGQQQRVAVARAIVFEPRVLLMDEPLGALDKKLRGQLQLELKRLQRRLDVTVVYVTHDQEEALTLSDQIVVMRDGRVEQAGTSEQIYEEPANAFVADFIGETNLLEGIVTAVEDRVALIEHPAGRSFRARIPHRAELGQKVRASVRLERLALTMEGETPDGANCWDGRVSDVTYVGDITKYHVVIGETRPALAQTIVVKSHRGGHARIGQPVRVVWDPASTRLLDGVAGAR